MSAILHKTAELRGYFLERAVRNVKGGDEYQGNDAAAAWALIESERITVGPTLDCWIAVIDLADVPGYVIMGATPIEAVLRAYVYKHAGAEVEL